MTRSAASWWTFPGRWLNRDTLSEKEREGEVGLSQSGAFDSDIVLIVNGVAHKAHDTSRMQCDPRRSILPVTIFPHPGRCRRNLVFLPQMGLSRPPRSALCAPGTALRLSTWVSLAG